MKMKTIITNTAQAIPIGIINNKLKFEHCLQRNDPNTVLRLYWHSANTTPALLNWHGESELDRLRCDEYGKQ